MSFPSIFYTCYTVREPNGDLAYVEILEHDEFGTIQLRKFQSVEDAVLVCLETIDIENSDNNRIKFVLWRLTDEVCRFTSRHKGTP